MKMSFNFLHFIFFTHRKIHCVSVSKYPCKFMDAFLQFSIASNVSKETLISLHKPGVYGLFKRYYKTTQEDKKELKWEIE